MFDLWDEQPAKIVQLDIELCVILMTIACVASDLRGRHCLFVAGVPLLNWTLWQESFILCCVVCSV